MTVHEPLSFIFSLANIYVLDRMLQQGPFAIIIFSSPNLSHPNRCRSETMAIRQTCVGSYIDTLMRPPNERHYCSSATAKSSSSVVA